MWSALVAVVASLVTAPQPSATAAAERRILEIEHTRAQDVSALQTIAGDNVRLQRLAVRAIGRMERPSLAPMVAPFHKSSDARVRQEAASALGQLQATANYAELIAAEQNGAVRGELYTSAGRISPAVTGTEELLRKGLSDATAAGRTGAARGLESLFRLHRNMRATPGTIDALKAAFRTNSGEIPRQLILLTLNQQTAGDSA